MLKHWWATGGTLYHDWNGKHDCTDEKCRSRATALPWGLISAVISREEQPWTSRTCNHFILVLAHNPDNMNSIFRCTPLPLCALETTVWALLVCPRAVLTKCISLVGTTDHTETPAYASWRQIIKQMKWLPLSCRGSVPALGVQCGLHGCVQPALGKCSWRRRAGNTKAFHLHPAAAC